MASDRTEVKTLFHITILQTNCGRGQQKIHLRLLLGSRRKRVFHRAPSTSGGRCNLCPRVVGKQIKLVQKLSQVTDQQTDGAPNHQSNAHRCTPRDECLCQYHTQTCRPRYTRRASRRTVKKLVQSSREILRCGKCKETKISFDSLITASQRVSEARNTTSSQAVKPPS